PMFAYPSRVARYKPLSMPTLQTCPSAVAPAVADVPTAITATRHTNAQANARELIMIFVNFVFIVVLSFCLTFIVLAFFDFSSLRTHFLGRLLNAPFIRGHGACQEMSFTSTLPVCVISVIPRGWITSGRGISDRFRRQIRCASQRQRAKRTRKNSPTEIAAAASMT